MKSAKRWVTTGASTCALCRQSFPQSTKGLIVDIAADVELVTIVKFVCMGCAGPIATAVVGEEVAKRAAAGGGRS